MKAVLVIVVVLFALCFARPAIAQEVTDLACIVQQTVINPDGTRTSSVRFVEHCILLPITVVGAP